MANNEVTTNSVVFPPHISHGVLDSIPSGFENATLEVIFKGSGGLLWQSNEKLSAAYLNQRIVTKAVNGSVESTFQNASDMIPLDNQPVAVSIRSDRVLVNKLILNMSSHRSLQGPSDSNIYLGYVRPQNPNPFNGQIYAIRYYSRILSDDETRYNQRIDNVRFNLGLDLDGPLTPYVPNRSFTLIEEEDER